MPRRKSAAASAQLPSPISLSISRQPIFPPDPSAPRFKKGKSTAPVQLTARPLYKNLIWVIDDFFNSSECASWISHACSQGFQPTHHPATCDTAFRDNGRVEFWNEQVAGAMWNRLSAFIPHQLAPGNGSDVGGCYAKIRLYRYGVGQRFGKHVDQSVELEGAGGTKITVLVYLNDDGLDGGETVFYDGKRDERVAVSFKPKRGSLLFHGHGNMCLTHEAKAVTRGEKYVLRTDVTYT